MAHPYCNNHHKNCYENKTRTQDWRVNWKYFVLWAMIDNKSQKVKRKCHRADSSDLANPRTRTSILGWKPRWDVTGTILGPGGDSSTGRWQEMWKKCQPGALMIKSCCPPWHPLDWHCHVVTNMQSNLLQIFSFWPQTVTSALDPIRIKTTPSELLESSTRPPILVFWQAARCLCNKH